LLYYVVEFMFNYVVEIVVVASCGRRCWGKMWFNDKLFSCLCSKQIQIL